MSLPTDAAGQRHKALLAEILAEFPAFEVVAKRESALQRAIAVALAIVTVGGQRHYMTRYHTVLFGRLYVPDAWASMSDDARYITGHLLVVDGGLLVQQRSATVDIFPLSRFPTVEPG